MSPGCDEEGGWAADKRDFVAARRDESLRAGQVADSRDRTADDRSGARQVGRHLTPARGGLRFR